MVNFSPPKLSKTPICPVIFSLYQPIDCEWNNNDNNNNVCDAVILGFKILRLKMHEEPGHKLLSKVVPPIFHIRNIYGPRVRPSSLKFGRMINYNQAINSVGRLLPSYI